MYVRKEGKYPMKNVKLFALATLVVVMVVAACGGGETATTQPAAGTQPTAVAGGQEPTLEVAPTMESVATTAAEEDLSLGSITEGLAQLKSYKSKYTIRFTGKDAQGQAVENSWGMAEEFILDPRAQHILATSSQSTQGQVTESSQYEMITIGQTTYMITQEADGTTSCISISSSDATPPEQSLSPDMWGGVSDAQYVNTETVNGIRAKHYAWKEGSFGGFGWVSGKGDTWVAEDGGFVVKQVIEGTGKGFLLADDTQEGTTTVEYEVTDANGSFEIAPPAGCEGPSTDIPVMADAVETMTYGDTVSYRSPSAFADVVNFYKTEMPAAGWEASGEPMEVEGYTQLTYTKDTRTATVMLTSDASTQETTVFIQVAKQ
jgi:hypothetical protein